MWVAYAKNEEAARELAARLLKDRAGEIVWSAWPMEPVRMEAR